MSEVSAIKGTVEGQVGIVLDDYDAWPRNMLRLQLECLEKKRMEGVVSGIYQGKTGEIFDKLERAGEINQFQKRIDGENHRFISNPGVSEVDDEVIDRFENVNDFLEKSGHFGALIAYVTLCTVWDEIDGADVDVFPEGSYTSLYHVDREPDSMMVYPNEYIPIEVYNGRDYLDVPSGDYESEKYQQLYDYNDTPDGHELNCNPFLINRRSTDSLRTTVRTWDGMVIDTDCIVACEERKPKIIDDIEFFGIQESIEFIEKIKAGDGTHIDGEDFEEANPSSPLFRPISALADNDAKIPSFYMERVRGGIQLHYVNSYFRRRNDKRSHQACRIVQQLYNDLLREGGKERDTAKSDAWDRANIGDAIEGEQKLIIADKIDSIINELINQKVIHKRKTKIYARRSEHPQKGLSFNI